MLERTGCSSFMSSQVLSASVYNSRVVVHGYTTIGSESLSLPFVGGTAMRLVAWYHQLKIKCSRLLSHVTSQYHGF